MPLATRLKVIDVYCRLIARMLDDAESANDAERAARLYAQARYELEFVTKSLNRTTQPRDAEAGNRAIA